VTKLHEAFLVGPVVEINAQLSKISFKGEFVLLIAPASFQL
jgi:16S rRNA C1402 (ribose-2'-O) methylase RsmI